MTPALAAQIHASAFSDHPRPWSEAEIAEILTSHGCFLLSRDGGFLLGRVIADEAELLTLAVTPEARRHGLGASLVREFHAQARALGATRAFLEVAADNAPAQALYAGHGWQPAGRRRNYYAPGLDALVLTHDLDVSA